MADENEVGTADSHEEDDEDLPSVDQNSEQTDNDPDKKEDLSPIVNRIKWGCVNVETFGEFKDVILYPGGAETWDWAKTDTHHQPGIQPADVLSLLDHDCQIIILSCGMKRMLHTSDETRQLLKEKHMQIDKHYFILQSEKAIELYNKYVHENKRVGALIHSTC